MKILAPSVFALLLFAACTAEPCGPDPQVGKLKRANSKLKQEIELLEEYGKEFEEAYQGLIEQLDRANTVKDSLYATKDDLGSYDPAIFEDMEKRLSDAQQTINDLRERLESNESSSSIMGVLRMQLEQAENRIAYLEDANNTLVVENERMKEVLEKANQELVSAEDEADKAEEELERAKKELIALEVQAQNELDEQLRAEKAAAAEKQRLMTEAAGFYDEAMKGFLDLENYIVPRNNGKFKIKKNNLNRSNSLVEAKRIAREVFDNLSEATRRGHPNSEKAMRRLSSEPRYQEIRPIGLNEF